MTWSSKAKVGNALLRGHARVTAEQVSIVLGALDELCPVVRPDGIE